MAMPAERHSYPRITLYVCLYVCMYVCLYVCPNLLRVWLYVCHLLIVKPAVCVGKPSVRAKSKLCFAAPVWK